MSLPSPSPSPSPSPPPRPRVVALRQRTPALWPLVLLWVVGLAVVLGVAGVVLFGSPGSARTARRIADREMQMTLEPGERVEGSAHVVQRHALDYFRETHGTLTATDRRLIFIGVLPRDFLEPERDLPAFDVRVYPYDTVLTLRGARVFFDRAFGVRVRAEGGSEAFSVSRGEWSRVQDVVRGANRHVLAVRQSVEREREAVAEAAARPPVRVFHKVARGESLIAIARLYSTTPESLLVLNAKRDSSLRAGDALLVRVYRDTTVAYRDTLMPGRRP